MNDSLLPFVLSILPQLGIEKAYWRLLFQQEVTVNRLPATLLRFIPHHAIEAKFFTEHCSFVINNDKSLLGFVRLEAKLADDKQPLPTEEAAKTIADDFLQKIAPDLLQKREILWIRPHDEEIIVTNQEKKEEKVTITGMKVKCRDKLTGLYFWVIVGRDRQVFVFERNIKWIVFPGKRGTEKWLHDEWLNKIWQGEFPITS